MRRSERIAAGAFLGFIVGAGVFYGIPMATGASPLVREIAFAPVPADVLEVSPDRGTSAFPILLELQAKEGQASLQHYEGQFVVRFELWTSAPEPRSGVVELTFDVALERGPSHPYVLGVAVSEGLHLDMPVRTPVGGSYSSDQPLPKASLKLGARIQDAGSGDWSLRMRITEAYLAQIGRDTDLDGLSQERQLMAFVPTSALVLGITAVGAGGGVVRRPGPP